MLGLAGLDFLAEAPQRGGVEHLGGRFLFFVEQPAGDVSEAVKGLQAQVFDLEVHSFGLHEGADAVVGDRVVGAGDVGQDDVFGLREHWAGSCR